MKRPLLVSIFCILGFIGAILSPILLLVSNLSPVGRAFPSIVVFPTWYVVSILLLGIVYLIATLEIWKMRKRGIELYSITMIISFVIGFSSGFASINGLIFSVILIGLIWIYYNQMTEPSLFSKRTQA